MQQLPNHPTPYLLRHSSIHSLYEHRLRRFKWMITYEYARLYLSINLDVCMTMLWMINLRGDVCFFFLFVSPFLELCLNCSIVTIGSGL